MNQDSVRVNITLLSEKLENIKDKLAVARDRVRELERESDSIRDQILILRKLESKKKSCLHLNGYFVGDTDTFICPDCPHTETVPNRGHADPVNTDPPGQWVKDLFRKN